MLLDGRERAVLLARIEQARQAEQAERERDRWKKFCKAAEAETFEWIARCALLRDEIAEHDKTEANLLAEVERLRAELDKAKATP
jgi:hypothetical protein